jgi:curved DNA-binding protein CbpA
MSQREQTNYYEVLEVSQDAPTTEIHKAYQRARQTYSQDNPALYSMFSAEEARELLRLIDEAYNVLSNHGTRKAYDESLGASGSKVMSPVGGGFSKAPDAPQAHSSSPNANQPTSSQSANASAHYSSHSASDPVRSSPMPSASASPSYSSNSSASNNPPPVTMNAFDTNNEGEFVVRRREQSKPSLPAGTGRTGLSTYKLDDSFETEISEATEFDGGFLQRIRLYKNISIDKMSDATRISRPYLMAVETNDYKSLPAAVFVRGFIVQVARQLGLDEQKAAASYMKLFKAGGGK